MWFLLFFSRKYVKRKNATNKLCKFSGVNSLKAPTHEGISLLENCQDPMNEEKSLITSLTRNSMELKRNNKRIINSKTPKLMSTRDSMGKERVS